MRVQLDHITKIFGKLRANDDITMTLEGGQIYAILGENGAGKSTLMKILSGFQPADSGEIRLEGRTVHFDTPADALLYGIGMLHQDPLDVPSLTVLENFILGRGAGLLPDREVARAALSDHAKRLGFNLNPDSYIDSLTIGERQQLEIIRLLSLGAHILILDEPTTGISTEQKDTLFHSLKRLAKDEGLTVVLVSHKLEDVEALCDRVYVLRAGNVVGEQIMPCSTDELVTMMFGQQLDRAVSPPLPEKDSTRNIVLSVRNLSVPGRRLLVKGVYLDVYEGEIVGLAGLDGSGQDELLRACAGLRAPSYGKLLLAGEDVTQRRYHEMVSLGVAYAPAGRLEEGLVPGMTLIEHFALSMRGGTWVDWRAAFERAEERIAHYNIRGNPDSQIQTLSGGNQQRVLLALLPSDLRLLLLDSPTRGLDVESARWVWSQLIERRQKGTMILFMSPDLDEIMEYSDRIVVFFGGKTTIVEDPAKTTVLQLGQLIGGKS